MKSFKLIESPKIDNPNIFRHPDIWDAHREGVKAYCDAVRQNNGDVEIEYKMKSEYGRYYAKTSKMKSCTSMWNALRSTLFQDENYDIDIVNCHPNILLHLIGQADDAECLSQYCNDRDKIISMFKFKEGWLTNYNATQKDNLTEKDVAKQLFTILMYGGTIKTWENSQKLTKDDYTLPSFVEEFCQELNVITYKILKKQEFAEIKKYVIQKKREEAKEKARKENKPFDEDYFSVSPAKILSVILQDEERKIVTEAINFVQERQAKVTAYAYDGFLVRKNGFSPELLDELNEMISRSNQRIKFIIKPFKPALDLNVLPPYKSCFDTSFFNSFGLDEYQSKKYYFERYFCKVYDPPCYVRQDDFGNCKLMKTKDFMDAYNHLTVTVEE